MSLSLSFPALPSSASPVLPVSSPLVSEILLPTPWERDECLGPGCDAVGSAATLAGPALKAGLAVDGDDDGEGRMGKEKERACGEPSVRI